MSRDLPDWQSFDPDEPSPLPLDEPDRAVVALVATEEGRRDDWAARAAASLAGAMADRGRRVFLADLGLREPSLHRVLGVSNGEGVTDAFLYGASVRRIARPVEGGRFFFAPAGTAVADPGSVASSGRWSAVLDAFHGAGASVLLFVPSGQEGADALLERATDVVVLCSDAPDGEEAVSGTAAERVRARWGPDEHGAAPAAPAETATRPPAEAVPDEPEAVPGEAGGAPAGGEVYAAPAVESGGVARPADEASDELPPAELVRPRPSERAEPGTAATEGGRSRTAGRGRLVLLLVLLIVVAVLAAAWYGLLDIPGVTPTPPDASAATPAGVAPAGRPAGEEPVLGASLALGSYRDPAVAGLQAEALAERFPDLQFLVAPVEVDGELHHRLLAGPAADSAEAAALREVLAGTLTREDPQSWVIRSTPFGWRVAEGLTSDSSRSLVETLRVRDIPAYRLQMVRERGAPRFRVYVGAYADFAEAAAMEGLLTRAGVTGAVLTPRTGRVPAP